jgi:hypothetical protein
MRKWRATSLPTSASSRSGHLPTATTPNLDSLLSASAIAAVRGAAVHTSAGRKPASPTGASMPPTFLLRTGAALAGGVGEA